jgi:hypothetical protein
MPPESVNVTAFMKFVDGDKSLKSKALSEYGKATALIPSIAGLEDAVW